jgi:transcriptional regulator with XRE-family HTH domain
MAESAIGQRLKILMEQLRLDVREFSQALGVGETTTRNYFNRGSKPSADYLEKLGNTFESVNMNWLLNGRGEPFLSATAEPTALYQKNKKITQSQIIGKVGGNVIRNQGTSISEQSDSGSELAAAQRELELLRSQLADKERTIQILLNQLPGR